MMNRVEKAHKRYFYFVQSARWRKKVFLRLFHRCFCFLFSSLSLDGQADTVRLMYAFHESDPVLEEEATEVLSDGTAAGGSSLHSRTAKSRQWRRLPYHGVHQRGYRSVYLLEKPGHGLQADSQIGFWEFRNPNVSPIFIPLLKYHLIPGLQARMLYFDTSPVNFAQIIMFPQSYAQSMLLISPSYSYILSVIIYLILLSVIILYLIISS